MDNDTTGIMIAAIPGIFALILALLAMYERKQDKKSERIKREKESDLETIREHSKAAIKKIADEITEQWQKRVADLESQVKALTKQVDDLREELTIAYNEIKRLRSQPSNTQNRRAKAGEPR
jgi:septal ring factor EnvC (AmiA/AmiB activator)